MELRHLRYFVAVAEELHFGRAAKKLHMAQPPLSQQIIHLENELGLKLFHRTNRRVSLTDAGEAFLTRVRDIFHSLNKACTEAQRIDRGELGLLVVSFMSAAMLGTFPGLLRTFHEKYPDVTIDLQQVNPANLLESISAKHIDVGFVSLSYPHNRTVCHGVDITVAPLWQEELLVAVHRTHPFASAGEASLASLAEQPLISPPKTPPNGYFDHLVNLFRTYGYSPNFQQEGKDLPTLLTYVAANFGIGIVPACALTIAPRETLFVPIADKPTLGVSIAYRTDNTSAALRAFLETAQQQLYGLTVSASMMQARKSVRNGWSQPSQIATTRAGEPVPPTNFSAATKSVQS